MTIYLDNAATTALDPRVVEAMEPYLRDHFGNPSSTHSIGRTAKAALESARKSVAKLLGASPAEIYFTSGGTEADNQFLLSAAHKPSIDHAITCATEHHAVLHTMEFLRDAGCFQLHYVNINESGEIDVDHLASLLDKYPRSLVSLMHGNNEIGNLIDLHEIGAMCKDREAIFHSDTVQTVAHFPFNLNEIPVDSVAASAHKFHGPKGTGLMYVKHGNEIRPLIHGGSQERNMRGGTENIAGIVGLAKALEIASAHMEQDHKKILGLKQKLIARLTESIPDIKFNGLSATGDRSLYTVLNLTLPPSSRNDMLLFHLDLEGICASGGSACNSGATTGSHVLSALGHKEQAGTVRLSFSKFNSESDIDTVADILISFCTSDD